MCADHVTHIHPAKNNISLRRKILAEEEALYIHIPVSLRGEALGRMVWSWYHFLILKIDMVMSTGMSRLNCVGEESLASSSQENRLEFQHLKWIVIICRKNNPGARKAVYQIGLITPKVKCFCPVILNFVCSSIFLIEDVYSKGRRNFLRLVLQDPSWCGVVVVDCKDVFSHPHCVPHPFFLESNRYLKKKRWTPCQGGFVGPMTATKPGQWMVTNSAEVVTPPFRGCG